MLPSCRPRGFDFNKAGEIPEFFCALSVSTLRLRSLRWGYFLPRFPTEPQCNEDSVYTHTHTLSVLRLKNTGNQTLPPFPWLNPGLKRWQRTEGSSFKLPRLTLGLPEAATAGLDLSEPYCMDCKT